MDKKIEEKISVAERFAQLVDSSDYSRDEISKKIGFKSPNIVTMIKKGDTKLPVNRIPRIAQVFNIDPAELFKQVMLEYEPEKYDAIIKCVGDAITKKERKVLNSLYEAVGGNMIKNDTSKCCTLIKEKLTDQHVTICCKLFQT